MDEKEEEKEEEEVEGREKKGAVEGNEEWWRLRWHQEAEAGPQFAQPL